MTTTKKPRTSRPERAYREEIEDAHATLDSLGANKGVFLNERVAGLGKMLAHSRSHAQTLALKVAEFVGEVVTIFDVPPPDGDAVRNSNLLLAELRKVRESARADRHNLHSAEETIATLTGERDRARAEGVTLVEENLRLRAELDAAVDALGKPDARASDDVATIAALAAICETIGPDDGQTAKHYVELAREAARAARGLS